MNPKIISERLGHWDVGFALRAYAASMADMQEEATERMEATLSMGALHLFASASRDDTGQGKGPAGVA
jgi:hypothetical protein